MRRHSFCLIVLLLTLPTPLLAVPIQTLPGGSAMTLGDPGADRPDTGSGLSDTPRRADLPR